VTPAPAAATVTRSAAETEALGAALAPSLVPGDVVVLRGPLGAGKTRFVAGMARGLDARSRVRSPTFTLVHEYAGRVPLAHVDLYRVETGEVRGLGLEELAERDALVVEWGERLPEAWRREALDLLIEPQEDGSRAIEASASAGRGLELLQDWNALTAEPRR
jgi:tRNA threonylcarbamoyladenosine biosynthesis protein TsaE